MAKSAADFIRDLGTNGELRSQLENQFGSNIDLNDEGVVNNVAALAQSMGYNFSGHDLRKAASSQELSDEALEGIAGGTQSISLGGFSAGLISNPNTNGNRDPND